MTKAILVSHTHWDRAWYLPYESFRFRLVALIDRVIDLLQKDPGFSCFVLDGQTILIEDYLEIKPGNRAILEELIARERLIIGPWYVLPDLFLVSGESIIRNLQVGQRMCRELGSGMRVGYVPDPFGHIAQLPQILNEFDISTFIFMRGMPEELAEKKTNLFHWKSPGGGHSVLAYYLRDGYYNAAALGHEGIQGRYELEEPELEKALESVRNTIDILSEYSPSSPILLNNGVDHMPEQPRLPALIRTMNDRLDDIEIVHGHFGDFMEEAVQADTDASYTGNLLGNPDHPILLNVYSSRIYLKQQNHHAQSKLEKFTEPMQLLNPDPEDKTAGPFLDYAWKTLLKNHPHDDICGCSTDEVHEENEVRFSRTEQVCDAVMDNVLEAMVANGFRAHESPFPEGEKVYLIAFNPHPHTIERAKLEGEIHFKNPGGKEEEYTRAEQTLRAFDSSGCELELQVEESSAPVMKAEYINHRWGRTYKLLCQASLPPLGYEIITVVAGVAGDEANPEKKMDYGNGTARVENDHAALVVENGEVSLQLKKMGSKFSDILKFEYMQDAGDTYSFSRTTTPVVLSGSGTLDEKASNENRLVIHHTLQVPASLDNVENIPLHLETTLSLRADGSVAVRVNYENRAENGRLRALLLCPFAVEESYSDGHFTLTKNKVKRQVDPDDDPARYNSYPGEMVYTTHYQGDFSFVETEEYKIWVAARGIHENELVTYEKRSWFALTLHRAVGYLSVSGGSIRRPQAGPSIPTPGAQCKRELQADFCWGITGGELDEVFRSAREFAHPPQLLELPDLRNSPVSGPLPLQKSLLEITNGHILLSSLKRAQNSRDIILRLYNPTEVTRKGRVRLGFECFEYCRSTLKEEWNRNDKKEVEKQSIDLDFKPHEIVTFRIRPS